MNIPWTKIDPDISDLGFFAYLALNKNEKAGCSYHNKEHIFSMYRYLADTNEPYDKCLDWAVLFHDIVYDSFPEKEKRSAEKFREMVAKYPNSNLTPDDVERIVELIMTTETHLVNQTGSYSAIVRADLHGLSNPKNALENMIKIMNEAMKLYSIDAYVFAKAGKEFMEKLEKRILMNIDNDPAFANFYRDVISGISFTILIYMIFVKYKENTDV